MTKVRPLEEQSLVQHFHYPLLADCDFEARPMVLLVGQYSVGKTSFIRYLLESDFPGMHVGPEPTTDRFQAIMYGAAARELPGNALASNPDTPFYELSRCFGNAFLSKFSGCEVPSLFARGCTLIDTPGVLSGRKQTEDRLYSYEDVVRWFAPRADLILLMFDAHKVDISDEFKRVIEVLQGHDDKVRVVMNKADSLSPEELLRVNSALSWSLSRILRSPESRRVYVGSFWERPLRHGNFLNPLFESEAVALLTDLAAVPRNCTVGRINALVARTRRVRVQALLLQHLRAEMPKVGSKDRKQRELIAGIEDVFYAVMKRHNLPAGDFPDVSKFRHTLATSEACRDFAKFKKLDPRSLDALEAILSTDVAQLMERFDAIPGGGLAPAATEASPSPSVHAGGAPVAVPPMDPWAAASPAAAQAKEAAAASTPTPADPWSHPPPGGTDPWSTQSLGAALPESEPNRRGAGGGGGAGSAVLDGLFGVGSAGAAQSPAPSAAWVVSATEKARYDSIFQQMAPDGGRASGAKVAPVLRRSGLPNDALKAIWSLCDVGGAGSLDADWFSVAMHLAMRSKKGEPLPQVLPPEYVPPSAR